MQTFESLRQSSDTIHVGIDATTWLNDRGFGRFTREIVVALSVRNAGFRYTLLFDQVPVDDLPSAVEVISASTKRSLRDSTVGAESRSLGYLWRVSRAARRARFDVFFYPAVYSYFPILTRTPCVVCYHDTTAERLPQLLFPTKLNHRLWQLKTAIAKMQTTRAMTVSQSSAADLHNLLHIPQDRIDIVTEAADPIFRVIENPNIRELARSRYQIPEIADLLVVVGGMNAHKNVLGLLKAMPEIIERRPSVHLAIVGSLSGKGFWDNVPKLLDFVSSCPELQKHVHFTDYIDDGQLVELLNASDALVFPSLWEGFGLPAIEAMSCGVPVLASERGSLPEVVADAGLFFDPERCSSIVECILEFLKNVNLRQRLSAAALDRARTFTWKRAAELAERSFLRCYQESTNRDRNVSKKHLCV